MKTSIFVKSIFSLAIVSLFAVGCTDKSKEEADNAAAVVEQKTENAVEAVEEAAAEAKEDSKNILHRAGDAVEAERERGVEKIDEAADSARDALNDLGK